MRTNLILTLLLALGLGAAGATSLSGCVVHGRAGVTVSGPRLAYVGPGLYVVSDYGEPVFYSDGWYWWYSSGIWYQSSVYDGGWFRASTVPIAIRRIDRPRAYIHYRARGPVYRRGDVDHRERWTRPAPRTVPRGRDHRTAPPPPPRERRATPPPGRDHRVAPPPPRERRATPPPKRDHRDDRDKDKRKGRDHR